MSSLKINDLNPAEFQLSELSDLELDSIVGGLFMSNVLDYWGSGGGMVVGGVVGGIIGGYVGGFGGAVVGASFGVSVGALVAHDYSRTKSTKK